MPGKTPNALLRLRKHADYQRVYASSRKYHTRQMSFFFSLRPAVGPDGKDRRSDTPGPRIGLTVGKVLGKAVERNRIKRRLRERIRQHAVLLSGFPVDVILHPRRTALAMDAGKLDQEVLEIFRTLRKTLERAQRQASATAGAPPDAAIPTVALAPSAPDKPEKQ